MESEVNVTENNLSEEITINENTNTLKWSQLLLFLLYFVGIGAVIGIVIAIYGRVTQNPDIVDFFSSSSSLVYILDGAIFFLAFLTFKSVRNFTLKKLDFSVMRAKKTYMYIGIGFVLFFVIQYITIYLLKVDDPTKQDAYLGASTVSGWFNYALFIFAIALITPIKEELLYRGLLFSFIETKYPKYGFWLGLITSSLIFGLLHPGVIVASTIEGMIFVLLYHRTKSLIPSMTLHLLWNLFASILYFIS